MGFGQELDLRIICPIELILSGFYNWLKILITFLKNSVVNIIPGSRSRSADSGPFWLEAEAVISDCFRFQVLY